MACLSTTPSSAKSLTLDGFLKSGFCKDLGCQSDLHRTTNSGVTLDKYRLRNTAADVGVWSKGKSKRVTGLRLEMNLLTLMLPGNPVPSFVKILGTSDSASLAKVLMKRIQEQVGFDILSATPLDVEGYRIFAGNVQLKRAMPGTKTGIEFANTIHVEFCRSSPSVVVTDEMELFSDGHGHYLVDASGKVYWGDGKTFQEIYLRPRILNAEHWMKGKVFDSAPRYKNVSTKQADLIRHPDGGLELQCPNGSTLFHSVPKIKSTELLKAGRFFPLPDNRHAVSLGKIEGSNDLVYVDKTAYEPGPRGTRVFIGKAGALKPAWVTDVVVDSGKAYNHLSADEYEAVIIKTVRGDLTSGQLKKSDGKVLKISSLPVPTRESVGLLGVELAHTLVPKPIPYPCK